MPEVHGNITGLRDSELDPVDRPDNTYGIGALRLSRRKAQARKQAEHYQHGENKGYHSFHMNSSVYVRFAESRTANVLLLLLYHTRTFRTIQNPLVVFGCFTQNTLPAETPSQSPDCINE